MAIERWDPQRDLIELQGRMNRLFDDALSRSVGSEPSDALGSSVWRPPLDLVEEEGRYVMRVDLPGVAASDVEIQVEDGNLVMRGERRAAGGGSRESYLRVERPQGRFSVQIRLPRSVLRSAIRATHANGVVEIVLPKHRAEATNRIEVSSQGPGSAC